MGPYKLYNNHLFFAFPRTISDLFAFLALSMGDLYFRNYMEMLTLEVGQEA